ncbi:TPA: glycosyltransferase family 4 protein [Vibrio vulnificus]
MISILYINPQSYNNLSKYDLEIFNNLSSEVKINYVCSDKLDVDLEFTSSVSSVNKLFKYNEKRHIFKLLSYLSSLIRLFFLISRMQPDIIHVQWGKLFSVERFFYKLVKKIFRTNLLFTVHNIYPHGCNERKKKTYRKFVQSFDHLFVHEETTKEQLTDWFDFSSKNITCITHGVIPFKNDKSNFDDFSLECFFKSDEFITFSFLGYGEEYKGIIELLNAWKNNTFNNSRLLIAGKLCESARQWLKCNQLPDNTFIVDGRISDNDLYHISAKTSVVLLPYKAISQSGLLLSTIPQRVPVIVTSLPGLLQPFKVGPIGWVIDECTEINIFNILEELSGSPSDISSIRNNNALWIDVQRQFSWEQTAKKTESTYFEVFKVV